MRRLVRLWFRGASRLAPTIAERQAASLFLTPRGRRRRARREPSLDPARWGSLAANGRATEPEALTIRTPSFRLTGWRVGDGPTVLLVHGWSGSSHDMVPLAAALGGAGHRVVLVDMPAHGRSAGRRTSLFEWLHALRAVADAVGPLETVVGHSLGGAAITVALAEGYLAAGAAVLVAPALGPSYFVERFARAIGLPPERDRGLLRHIAAMVGREVESFDVRGAAAALAIPALVLHDPADREVPWEQGEMLSAAWRGSLLQGLAGVGHRRILKDERTIAATVDFVRSLRAGR